MQKAGFFQDVPHIFYQHKHADTYVEKRVEKGENCEPLDLDISLLFT